MSVSVRSGTGLELGEPELVLERPYLTPPGTRARSYDVRPDGERFLMLKEGGGDEAFAPEIILVQNWLEELKRLVPRE